MFIGELIGGVTGGGGLGGTSTSAASGTSPQDQTQNQNIYFGGARKKSLPTWVVLAALGAATFYVVRSKK